MKRYSKYLIATAVAVVLSVICAIISLVSLPELRVLTVAEDAVSVADQAAFSRHDCIQDSSGAVVPTGGDPQTVIAGVGGNMTTLCIRLEEPMIPGTFYQLYYTYPGGEFAESNSISFYSAAGQTDLVFFLGDGEYENFRLDVGGSYYLSDILVSRTAPGETAVDRIGLLLGGDITVLNGRQWIITLVALWVQAMLIVWQRRRIVSWVKARVAAYRQEPRKFWFAVLRFVLSLAVAMVLWAVLGTLGVFALSFYSWAYFFMGGCALGSFLALWNQTAEHPERVFTALIVCVGFAFALLMPRTAMVSWDDETHYRNALDLSYGGESWYTGADALMYPMLLSNEMSLSNADAVEETLNTLYETGASGSRMVNILSGLHMVAYLPSAAAIWLARAVGLPFTSIFVAGRLGSVLGYAVVLYFAMKRLKGNNLLIGVFALLPTMIFIASNYSYDGWCLSFLALGTAIFLDEYRHPERAFSWPTALAMLCALALGCMPKAIYFPVFLLGLFVPKEKFRSKKERRCYYAVVVLFAFVMALSFAAPFLFSGGASHNDTRGGSGVDSGGQIGYILSDPIHYAKLLLRFLFVDYFKPTNVVASTVSFLAYMGSVAYGWLFVALLAIVFLAERRRDEAALRQPAIPAKLAALVSFFCAVCLAATAMYVAYTPVGHHTINGCQWRYMMPVLLPMLLQVRPNRTWMPIPRKWFNAGVIALEGILLFAGLWPYMACYL